MFNYLRARANTIEAGTSEIQRLIIGSNLVRSAQKAAQK